MENFTVRQQSASGKLKPGRWREICRDGKPDDPPDTIKFACPDCGCEGDLTDHDIDADGKVSPSVICPNCGFHAMVVLDRASEPGQ